MTEEPVRHQQFDSQMPDFHGSLDLLETHQTLIQNGLRERVRIETDGKLMSGRDVGGSQPSLEQKNLDLLPHRWKINGM